MKMPSYAIAQELDRDPRGIKYEIMQHRESFVRKNQKSKCGIQHTCKKKRLCPKCDSSLCKYCGHIYCDSLCDNIVEYPNCNLIGRFSNVCNESENMKGYSSPKVYYKAYTTHSEYINNIREHKKGPKLTEAEMKNLDAIISEGVKKGHFIEFINKTNHLPIAPNTIYRYIDENLLRGM